MPKGGYISAIRRIQSMDVNRKTAYQVLLDVESRRSYSNLALNHHIIINKPTNQGFVRELVYGVLENKMLLDYVIDALIPKDVEKMNVRDLTILRMGIYQLAKMNSVPEYAAVNESVVLAKRYARGREGFINGVLRGYINEKYSIKLPDRDEDEIRYLSIKYSYEPWIIKLWLESYDMDFVEELLKAGNEKPETCIRLNWLKVMKPDLIRNLEGKGFKVTEGKYSHNALYVSGGNLTEDRLYKNGLFSIQDEASQIAAQMLNPKHGDVVIDVCAGVGGKALAIAERMNNKGVVIACDIYKRKVETVMQESRRLGVSIVQPRTWDATRVDSTLVMKADEVLVDAPCSGLGTIRRKPEIKYKNYSDAISTLPAKQLSILSASAQYVKPGGLLIYSTCTINPYENERVVSDFLRRNKSFKSEETMQLLPNVNGTDGFFICKLRRTKNLIDDWSEVDEKK
jgi:16S rRNA (cytosine967-C5)-methyltransferase